MERRSLSFDITSPQDFLAKLRMEREALGDEPTSSRHAINAAMTAWHLWEWVWGGAVKPNSAIQQRLGAAAKDRRSFRSYILKMCPEMETMQCVCEGTKHFGGSGGTRLKATRTHHGAFDSGFSRAFDTSGGKVELADGSEQYFDVELDRVIVFWESFFRDYLDTH